MLFRIIGLLQGRKDARVSVIVVGDDRKRDALIVLLVGFLFKDMVKREGYFCFEFGCGA
jgi:hypothetical protein